MIAQQLYSYLELQLALTSDKFYRYLYDKIDWKGRMIGVVGPRGVGKTTMVLQYIKSQRSSLKALYVSADITYFTTNSLISIADEWSKEDGKILVIDEVHKYSNWSRELKQIYEDCKAAAKLAEDAGVVLGLECHNWTLTDTKESALALMNEVNSPAFKMFWQPNQFKSIEENVEYAKLLAPYVICVHAFNWEQDKKYPLALAMETWKTYLTQFNRSLPVLLEFMPDDKIETLSEESNSLHKILEN